MTNWNERYEDGDTPWEKGSPAPPLKEIAARASRVVWGAGPVLVPGCGFGHDARWIAAQGKEVVGIDLAEQAIAGAKARTEGKNPAFVRADFFQPHPQSVSAIFEHTCFCAIEPEDRPRYAAAAAEWLQPGGHLVAIFFLNPDHDHGPPYGCTLPELDRLFGKDFELLAEWEPKLAYPGREGREWVRILRRV
ncbi:methyltransferase domain-containing protein [Roseibacillus ishigakijimensis]|uniref:Methyltransferase domain-containing protein n=1 Tax=Roseibacillus ishigakijimensis TaxID=454146 RepID=A0A934VID6_9BACT|nr:methyltransferase domain-containing protein [Roseibacillus ishigakijimensis]MBK1834963.1 methyltransferase domain-containing protein [Roseibacillus ishigakijimensis]